MILFVLDFETRSRASLDYTNTVKYARDPSTEVICLSYGDANDYAGTRELWTPGQPFPFLPYHECTFTAFNAEFEISIWNECCVRQYNWPRLDPENIQCLMAAASYAGLPRNLKDVADTLDLPAKDADGHAVMLRCTRPVGANCNNDGAWIGGEYDRDPVKLQRVGEYCLRDGAVESRISTYAPPISPLEQQIWQANYEINMRGIPIDRRMCETAMWMVQHEQDRLQLELKRRTNGRIETVGQTLALTKWLKEQKVDVPNVRKETLDELDRSVLTENAARVLEIRRLARDAAVAKYQGMLCHAEADDRCRCAHIYYKSGTGRFAGAGVNFLNLRRLSDDEVADEVVLADRVSACSYKDRINLFVELQGTKLGVIPTLGKMVRLAIKAAPGKKLIVRDYSAIEMNVLHWLANDEATLEIIRRFYAGTGEEPYKLAAARMYHVPVAEVNKKQRQAGKVYYLGCFAADTQIITSNGIKPIKAVTLDDQLWDGESWVNHDGLLPKGKQVTVNVAGVSVTPEHEIWNGANWILAETLPTSCEEKTHALAAGWASLLSLVGFSINTVMSKASRCNVRVVKDIMSLVTNCCKAALPAVAFVPKRNQGQPRLRNTSVIAISYKTKKLERDFLIAFQPLLRGAVIRKTPIMADAESRSIHPGMEKPKVVKSFSHICLLWTAGIIRYCNWIISTTIRDTNPAICGLLQLNKTRVIDEPSRNLKPVFDILNSGSQNRFTILTRRGPLVVHNCGYCSGGKKLLGFAKNYGIGMDLEEASTMVKDYRISNPLVTNLWNRYWRTALKAIREPGYEYDVLGTTFRVNGSTLRIRLRSGRELCYYRPRIVDGPYGDEIECVDIHKHRVKNQTRRLGIATLIENVDQAISRDLLCDALLRARTENIPVILSVYDEIVAEVDENDDNPVNVLKQIMCDPPAWAKGLPIDVKGGSSQRYTK